jgi:hypothetical protein
MSIQAISLLFFALLLGFSNQTLAKECWALSGLKGQMATSAFKYAFQEDKFSNPMFLCFDGNGGSVSGDNTPFMKFGESTLGGWVKNDGLELFEVFQIDRANGKVFFTKSRIGTSFVFPGVADVIGAFVGTAIRLQD